MFPQARQWKYFYLAYFSKPAGDRLLYRAIRKRRVRKILEMGIGSGQRARRMIEAARPAMPLGSVSFTGIDLFELRSPADGPGISLKMAHRQLAKTGARVRLVPGEPVSALARTANSLGAFDLIVISADQEGESLAKLWFYVPRLVHEATEVFLEETSARGRSAGLRLISPADIAQLAHLASRRRAA